MKVDRAIGHAWTYISWTTGLAFTLSDAYRTTAGEFVAVLDDNSSGLHTAVMWSVQENNDKDVRAVVVRILRAAATRLCEAILLGLPA